MRSIPVVAGFLVLFSGLSFGSNRIEAGTGGPTPRPGFGFPGRIEPYPANPGLQGELTKLRLQAGWFRRDRELPEAYRMDPGRCPSQDIPFLLFVPSGNRRNLPLVLYLGGNGEHGTDLGGQFRQRTVFDIVCHPDFQKRHPCFLFAPMLPAGSVFRCAQPGWTSEPADLVCDAMYAAIRKLGPGAVDTNRLYVTGLSYGGAASFELCSQFPGRFAAAVPVAATQYPKKIPENAPGNYYLLFNEGEFSDDRARANFEDLGKTVRERSGDFRIGRYPASGHNAWDAAWREPAVWDWMFGKTADGKPVPASPGIVSVALPDRSIPPGSNSVEATDKALPCCTASKPGRDERTGPERVADGLEGTAYVSAEPMAKGDWLQIEFPEPFEGKVSVKSGLQDGTGRLSSGRVEVSSDGKSWSRCGGFSRSSGMCSFQQRPPVRFVRILPEPRIPETVVIREVVVE